MDAAIFFIASAFALCCALGSTLAASIFLSQFRTPRMAPRVPAAILLPATGTLPGLEDLLDDLANQTLRPRRMIVAVESQLDPAYERIRRLRERFAGFAIEIVVAGLADHSGQKCLNLIAAVGALTPEDGYVVFLDADVNLLRRSRAARRVRWAHIHYTLDKTGRVLNVQREWGDGETVISS